MIKIKSYEHIYRYQLEKLIKISFEEKKQDAPDEQNILDTISYFTSFPNCGKIFMIFYNNTAIGFAIIHFLWKMQHAKLSYRIDELYIDKSYRRYKPEVNLIEHLIKQEKLQSIEIKLHKNISSSRRIFRFFKFEREFGPFFKKIIE